MIFPSCLLYVPLSTVGFMQTISASWVGGNHSLSFHLSYSLTDLLDLVVIVGCSCFKERFLSFYLFQFQNYMQTQKTDSKTLPEIFYLERISGLHQFQNIWENNLNFFLFSSVWPPLCWPTFIAFSIFLTNLEKSSFLEKKYASAFFTYKF